MHMRGGLVTPRTLLLLYPFSCYPHHVCIRQPLDNMMETDFVVLVVAPDTSRHLSHPKSTSPDTVRHRPSWRFDGTLHRTVSLVTLTLTNIRASG
ncbi:hypothetical protein BJY52DRAFT_1277607 [Lactarius psammicola]|nr:hypothetical protein BJY52DRAFT_1277607 [Lactarius psammicola]